MSDPWLNFQYTIEFSNSSGKGRCNVQNITTQSIKHGSSSYIINSTNGDPERKYVYGGTYTDPVTISIMLEDGARPWLEWFSAIENGNYADTRNVTISLSCYGKEQGSTTKTLWLSWDLINCFPTSWQIDPMAIEEGPSPMKIEMSLQFESMVIRDGGSTLQNIMG